MMLETCRKYDEEFKKRAVRMSYSSERTVTQVAESLGISSNMLYRWSHSAQWIFHFLSCRKRDYDSGKPEILPFTA
jgi:transposase